MARNVFFSFHYQTDNWRASQVRNMGVIEGNKPLSDNDWEEVKKGGDAGIERWINGQIKGTSCTIVLIGTETSGRKWIEYEIKKSWEDGNGVLGIHIHNLKNNDGQKSTKGANPFARFTINGSNKKLSDLVTVYDPPYTDSTEVYKHIDANIEQWVEQAIKARGN